MADYQKMYAVLCSAVDEVIDPLERIPLALSSARILRAALARAEEIYICTAEEEEPNRLGYGKVRLRSFPPKNEMMLAFSFH